MSGEHFRELALEFNAWSANADRNESGWQSDFPRWTELIEEAKRAMRSDNLDEEGVRLLEDCWVASEEGEELLEYAKGEVSRCLSVVRLLAHSRSAACRWQAYETASIAGGTATSILRSGLKDADPYARRRALLSLSRVAPPDVRDLVSDFIEDSDPYIRQAAIGLIILVADSDFQRVALQRLANDEVSHVRQAAQARLSATPGAGSGSEP